MKFQLLLIILMLMMGCGGATQSYPHDMDSAETQIGLTYTGTATAFSGEQRTFSLLLEKNGQDKLTYELGVVYVGRSARPTVRTGGWFSDGKTLTLLIEEQDGEPTDQRPLMFEIDGHMLTATDYNTERFDFQPFVLEGESVD